MAAVTSRANEPWDYSTAIFTATAVHAVKIKLLDRNNLKPNVCYKG